MQNLHRKKYSICSGRTETASSTFGGRQFLHLFQNRINDALTDELRNAITPFDHKRLLAVIKQNYAYVATIVFIDDARTDIDAMFSGQTAARRNSTVTAGRHLDGQIGQDDGFVSGSDRAIVRTDRNCGVKGSSNGNSIVTKTELTFSNRNRPPIQSLALARKPCRSA